MHSTRVHVAKLAFMSVSLHPVFGGDSKFLPAVDIDQNTSFDFEMKITVWLFLPYFTNKTSAKIGIS
jgi:hypothetical protein